MKMPAFDYAAPETLAEALQILSSRRGEARVLAGGQSLLPLLAFRMAAPTLLVDLRKVPALDRIAVSPQGVELGAMVRWCDIEESEALKRAHPLLVAATAHVAHYPIRNRGTVGGSLAHADFAAELPGVAVACDAEIVAVRSGGARRIPARGFFEAPLTSALLEDEVITALVLPAWPDARRWGFREFARQRGGFPLVGVAVYYDEVDPFLGESVNFNAGATFQPNGRFSESVDYTRIVFDRPATGARVYTVHLVNTRTTFQFSKSTAARAIVQYDSNEGRVLTDFLGSYEPRPGTVLYAGYGSLYQKRGYENDEWVDGEGLYLTTRRGLFLKASYLYRF